MGHIQHVNFLKDLSLRLNWIIEWKFTPGEAVGKIAFPYTLIWLVLKGERDIEVNGQFHRMKRGDIVFIPPHAMRDVADVQGEPMMFQYITVCCDIRVGSLEMSELYRFPLVVETGDQEEFMRLVKLSSELHRETVDFLYKVGLRPETPETLNKEIKTNEVTVDQTLDLLRVDSMFRTWFHRLFQYIRPHLPERPLFVDPRILDICSYIQRNLNIPLKISELARGFYLSESHLRLLFRKTFGMSPNEYLLEAKMKRTKELLLNSSYTLRDISEMVGFHNQNMFSRAFVKKEGISATEYRKRLKAREGKY
jgi:AraC-like DNA-binding protein